MFTVSFFSHILQNCYEAPYVSIQPISSACIPGVRGLCKVVFEDGKDWIVRVAKRDAEVPDWLVGCGASDTYSWLASRAGTLRHLAELNYPAPRMIQTQTEEAIGTSGSWCSFATTYIDGRVANPTSQTLFGIGQRLGQLHRLSISTHQHEHQPGQSWWYPQIAIPAVLAQYAGLIISLPDEWIATVDAFCTTLQTIQRQTFPLAVIHGDGWVANAVETPTSEIILIDWEPSGLGYAILDLGRLLLHAHQTLQEPNAVPDSLSSDFIHAVIDGYCSERIPTPEERLVLLEAIRFSVAFGAASHFARAIATNWEDVSPSRLKRRQRWFELSERIAVMAQERLALVC